MYAKKKKKKKAQEWFPLVLGLRHSTWTFNVIIDNNIIIIHIGTGLYLKGIGTVRNNSIIRMSASGRFNQLQCISGSTMVGVGQWIAPHGTNITNDDVDQFDVTVGGLDDPGFTSIELKSGASLGVDDEGIYTCIIPDHNDDLQHLFIGLYGRAFNSEQHYNVHRQHEPSRMIAFSLYFSFASSDLSSACN